MWTVWIIDGIKIRFVEDGVSIDLNQDVDDPCLPEILKKAQRVHPVIMAQSQIDDFRGGWGEYHIKHTSLPNLNQLIDLCVIADSDSEFAPPESVREVMEMIRAEFTRQLNNNEVRLRKEAEKQERRNRDDPGYVYLIQSPTGNYKIGRAKNVEDRISLFNVKLPFEVELLHTIECRNYRTAEQTLHEQFSTKRVNGEWFTLTPEDVAAIKAIQSL